MSKEAMKLALEAMQYADACLKKQLTTKTKHEYAQDLLLEAGKALEEALAKQEQELDPVHEYRKGFIAGQIDMRDRSEEKQEQGEPVAIIEELIPNTDSELLAVRWLSVEASFKNPVGTLLVPFKNIKEN